MLLCALVITDPLFHAYQAYFVDATSLSGLVREVPVEVLRPKRRGEVSKGLTRVN